MSSGDRKQYQRNYKKAYAKTHRQISVSVTNAQYRDFQTQADKENTKVSTLVRNMALAYLQQNTLVPSSISAELKELKFLIRNIANNVNQMAHYSNTIHQMVDENEFLEEIHKLEKHITDYTEKRIQTDKG